MSELKEDLVSGNTFYGKFLFNLLSLNGETSFCDAAKSALIPYSVINSFLDFGSSLSLDSFSISDVIDKISDGSYCPNPENITSVSDLISSLYAIKSYFNNPVVFYDEISKIGVSANICFFKESGKLAYSGVTFSGESAPIWERNDLFFLFLKNQNVIVPSHCSSYRISISDTDVNYHDPNYKYCLSMMNSI